MPEEGETKNKSRRRLRIIETPYDAESSVHVGTRNLPKPNTNRTIAECSEMEELSGKSLAYAKMKICLKDVKIDHFSEEWQTSILKLLAKKYKKQHSTLINSLLREVKDIYCKDMREFVTRTVFVVNNVEEDRLIGNSIIDRAIHNYDTFSTNKRSLESKYFLSLEVVKAIVNLAHLRLPNVICNLEEYHHLGVITLEDFQNAIEKDISKGSVAITNRFYVEVCNRIARTKMLQGVPLQKLSRIMGCVTNVFVQQILSTMIRSIEHVLIVMEDGRRCPQIRMSLVLEDSRLVVDPDTKDIFSVYHGIIERVKDIGQDLIPLEEWLDVRSSRKFVKVRLSDWFVEDCHERLQASLDRLYHPVNEHVARFTKEFQPICTSVRRRIHSLSPECNNFELYLRNVQSYRKYLKKANAIVANVYYNVGRLEQIEAKESLRKRSLDFINAFVEKLAKFHREFNGEICSEFERLKERALNVPKDAKALIELTEYIAQASKTLVNTLQPKIRDSVRMLSALLDITVLSDDHVRLNCATINWLYEIEPVFSQNNTLTEAMKSELEDDMQRRINVLNSRVDEIVPQLSVLDNMDDVQRVDEYVEYYKTLLKQVNEIDARMGTINEEERLFRFPETEFPKVVELKEIILPFYSLIRLINQWQRDHAVWLDGPFEWLDANIIERKTLSYFEEIGQMSKAFKVRIKMDVTASKCFKFSGIADDPDPMQQPAPLKLCWQALNDIDNFKKYLPLVSCVCNSALQKRHWDEMSAICDFDLTPNAGTSLRKIIELNLMDNIERYESISIGANRELSLQRRLSEMTTRWTKVSFEMILDDETNSVVFEHSNEIELLLADHLTRIEEMQASNFVKPIAESVQDFFNSLSRIQGIVEQWEYVQTRKRSVESIFAFPKIEARLGEETSLYNSVNQVLLGVQGKIMRSPSFHGLNDPEILTCLRDAGEWLEIVCMRVKDYFEDKRLRFPRLFFLSDEEIQRLLFESTKLEKLGVFLNKCFQGVQKLRIVDGSVCSVFGEAEEELRLDDIVPICYSSECEEEWLIKLEHEMNKAVRKTILDCCNSMNEEFLFGELANFPSMSIICALRIHWTSEVHSCLDPLDPSALNLLHARYTNRLTLLVDEMKCCTLERHRCALSSMIVVTYRQTEIIKLLLDSNVRNCTDFEWFGQSRHYLENCNVTVSMLNASMNYGYEYNYCKHCIVDTALTERCFHTLMQAFKYHLYGAILGPTATGKTETVKSLARTVAAEFRVFQCNDGVSYDSVCQALKGHVTRGVWICFENFEKLRVEVLSAIALRIVQISQAKSTNLRFVRFDGTSLNFNPNGFICAIMNSSNASYSVLPDNLRILFRSVSMLKPDLVRIAEVELLAAGFSDWKRLAVKLGTFEKLLSDQLRCERCNRFDICSVKSVIRTAKCLKRTVPEEDEQMLLLRALVDSGIPRLCDQDVLIYKSLLHDTFPSARLLPADYRPFLDTLESVCQARALHLHDVFKLKAIQTFETLYVQRGLILVGPPLSGKTEILKSLADTLSILRERGSEIGANVDSETITPAVASNERLFGHFDKSGIWIDGLCSKVLRKFAENESCDRNWLILDGPLKNPWTEHLYTALDDNRSLYLISGERITIRDSASLILETSTLEEASPGILSRCGVIYIEPESIDWKPFVVSHLSRHSIYEEHRDLLYSLFEWAMVACVRFVSKNCPTILSVGSLHLLESSLNLFEIFLIDACDENTEEKGKVSHFIIWAQAALIMAVTWAFGGNLSLDSHIKFNTFLTSVWNGGNGEFPKPETIKHFDIALPVDGLIQDNFYVFKGIGNWKLWADLLKGKQILEIPDFNQAFVPTANTMKYNHVFLKHVKHRKPFFLCGDVASGKTFFLQDLIKTHLPEEKYLCNFFSFTSFTNLEETQCLLLSKLNRIRRRHYGPPKDRLCIGFIDDLNTDDGGGINDIAELLRQYLNYGHFYDKNEPEKIFVHDVLLSLVLTVRRENNFLCPRLLRHFNVYTMYPPAPDTLFRIHSNVLFANLKRNLFAADVLGSVNSITNATIDVYKAVKENLKPVPGKFQYCFNIRDIVRVIGGCSLLHKESVETKVTFIRLWVHEVWRVFADRIIDADDKDWLFQKVRETVKSHFKDSFETAFDYLPKFGNQITKESFGDLMFGNFMNHETKRYEETGSMETVRGKVQSYLCEYNKSFKRRIDIVLSRYVLESLIKIARILSMPCNNLLMISTVGSGRRSTIRLAAYMQGQKLFEPVVQAYCEPNDWRNYMKTVLKECGGTRKDAALFLCGERMGSGLLRDVGTLLITGELPNLYSTREKHEIVEIVRLHAQAGDRNAEISVRAVMNYFVDQCKSKLHTVLCFGPTDDTLRSCLRVNSNLVRHCTVNWHERWPEEVLVQVASKYIEEVNVQENLKPEVVKACVKFHSNALEMSETYGRETGRVTHVTSNAFVQMLKLYTRLVQSKREEIVRTRNRYLAGLEKLELAAKQVEQMKTTLTVLKPQLELSAQQTMITMKEVENENITVERATTLVKQEEEVANKKAEIASVLKTECEADLAVAIPILEDAVAALNTLKPTDITLVKAMKNPPDTVKLVMAAVCVMLGVPADRTIDPVTGRKYTDYWSPSKRILGDMNFLQNLKEYDKDNIPASVMQVIKKTYMTDNSFMPHIVAKASSAAEGLCKWVRAMVSYDEVAKVVAPKKEKLLAAQRECDEAEAFLNEKRSTLAALNAKLAALNSSLQETLERKLKLEKEVENCTNKLNKAENLIASLGGEKNRWMRCAENLRVNNDDLIGDMILSCGIIVYTAAYSVGFRDKFLEIWKEYISDLSIPYTTSYRFASVLGVESKINRWYLRGLPKNSFSTENAIIMSNSDRWCLFVDSQNQANRWIKAIEDRNELAVVKLTDRDYSSIIKRNVETGRPVLIENVGERLDALLDPFLLKDIYKDGETWYLDTGNDVLRYCPDFRLYITTRLVNPRYSCEVFSKLTVIDFSIPNEALQDKLLDIVISKEKPELQEEFEELLVQDAANRKILEQQEDNILSILSSTNTNILEDENAIKTLDASKNLSLDVIKKQEVAKLTSARINKFRETYIQFVKYCAGLFDTLNTLSELNHMYRFSFFWFIQLYVRSIETSNRSIVLEKRLDFLKTSFTQNLHSSVCRSLSEKHKILYSFLLCSEILLDRGQTTADEIKFFMSTNVDQIQAVSSSVPDWLPLDIWGNVCSVGRALDVFRGLENDLCSSQDAWRAYYNSEPLENRLIPMPWARRLSQFQTLLLVKTVRPDKIIVQILQLIGDIIGDTVNYSPQTKISESYAESSCLTPLIFVLPSCFSPLFLVSSYASTKGYSSKFASLSMGEAQDLEAERLINQAQRDGGWVFLENCHLSKDWLAELERICENCHKSEVSLDFRLWLSSLPVAEFPISVLQTSIKITHDHPPNFKQNLLNVYQADPICSKDFFEGCPGKDKAFSKLLFAICFFHIVVRERRLYGIQGWNVPYDFEQTDLRISIGQLQDLINQTDELPFDTLWYLIGRCNYGGKVVDNFDQRCLECLLRYYANGETIIEQRYEFTSEIQRLIPQRCEYLHVIRHIEGIPLDLGPQLFGSNENGVIIRDTIIANEFLSLVSRLNRIPTLEDEIPPPDEVLQIIDEILQRAPQLDIVESIDNSNFVDLNPIDRVLHHEIELLRQVSNKIVSDLNDLRMALIGERIFAEPLEELARCLHKNRVPRWWRDNRTLVSSKYLSAYIDNILKRVDFVQSWSNVGVPPVFRLDAIFSCKMFFSAVLLQFSNSYKVPVEEIALEFQVDEENRNESESSDFYFIDGLYLSGARWNRDRGSLEEALTNIFWQEMPAMRFNCKRNRSNADQDYQCPVYKGFQEEGTITADNYVISIPLKTDLPSSHWVKCGTALFCQIP